MRIAIFGQIDNGKSTYAKMLMEQINDRIRLHMVEHKLTHVFQLAAFAKGVKESVAVKFHVPLSDVELWKNKKEKYPGWSCTMREALQIEGETSRQIDPNVWIRKVMNIPYPIIIQDGRYENEAKAIYESGGYNVLIFRPDKINDSQHPSETYVRDLILSKESTWKYFNHAICNNGTIERLREVAEEQSITILDYFKRKNDVN